MKRITKKQIDRALAEAGIEGEVFKGGGIVYFTGRDFDGVYAQSVYVTRYSDLSIERWIEEAKGLIDK